MILKEEKDFCIECRREAEFTLQKKEIVKRIRDKEYKFQITVAICSHCGEEMSILGLIDKNIQEIDEQYRTAEGIVSISDIKKLLKLCKADKTVLSIALGFEHNTISNYLKGQIPSKECSDVIKSALKYFLKTLNKRRSNYKRNKDFI